MNAKDKLILWLAGSGHSTTDTLADDRVKWELDQNPVDAVGLMRAIPYYARPITPREQLEFLQLFGG